MSERRAISASDFINKSTRLVEIDGFEPGEKILVKVKPVSLLAMMANGKLPNELKAAVASLFAQDNKKKAAEIDEVEQLTTMQVLMTQVCKDALVEPRYEEIGDYLTDGQKTQIFTGAQGNIKDYAPTDEK